MGLFDLPAIDAAPTVTFVCTGNICRSAYAEKALRHALVHGGNPWGLTVTSAGTRGLDAHPMDEPVVALARARGYDTDHVSRRVDVTVVDDDGLFLAMTAEHAAAVLEWDPAATHRVYTLAEFARCIGQADPRDLAGARSLGDLLTRLRTVRTRVRASDEDIADPYRQSADVHAEVAAIIDRHIAAVAPALSARLA